MEDWNALRRGIYKEEVHMNEKMHEKNKKGEDGVNRTRRSHNTKINQ